MHIKCTYTELGKRNQNFVEKYKVSNINQFKPICKLMGALDIPQNKKVDFFEKYYVPDLVGSNCKVLFILESPHRDEIIHKHPLAGSSGLNLSTALVSAGLKGITNSNNCYLPFGCWLQEHITSDLGKQFGIMNICNFPMQHDAYSCSEDTVKGIELLRNRIQLYTNKMISDTCSDIDKDIHTKIAKIRNKKMLDALKEKNLPMFNSLETVVICGNISLGLISYFNLFENKNKLYIAHPSNQGLNRRSNDARKRDKSVLSKIVTQINQSETNL